jgi:hypothetical protein
MPSTVLYCSYHLVWIHFTELDYLICDRSSHFPIILSIFGCLLCLKGPTGQIR